MEGTDFKGALQRGWRFLVLAGVLGFLLGLVLPVHSGGAAPNGYTATAFVTPSDGRVTVAKLSTYAVNKSVKEKAASNAGVGVSAAGFSISKPSKSTLGHGVHVSGLALKAMGKTSQAAAKRANAYAAALSSYTNQQVQNNYQLNLCRAQQSVNSLETELGTIDDEVMQEQQGGPGSVDVTQPATPTAPDLSQCDNTNNSDSTTSFVSPGGKQFVLTAASTPSSTPSAAPGSTPSSTAPANPAATTPSTFPDIRSANDTNDPTLALLLAQQDVTQSELNQAITRLSALSLSGPPAQPVSVLVPATANRAVANSASSSGVTSKLGQSRFARGLIGLLIGALIAAGVIVLLELTDKTLRSAAGTEEAFGFPVVTEIPMLSFGYSKKPPATPPTPRLVVALAPSSRAADSYRRLRTALVLEPLAAVRAARMSGNGYLSGNGYSNGNGHTNGNGVLRANGNGALDQGETASSSHTSNEAGEEANGNGYTNGNGNGHANGKRQVVLVVSGGREPSRPAVVANLAAVYAETGARVLVVGMGFDREGKLPPVTSEQDEIAPEDIARRATPASVPGVRALSLGQVLANPGQVVTHGPDAIDSSREVADVVIVEGSPLLRSHDALGLLPAVDVVLVVAEYAYTRSDDAKKIGDLLRRFEAPVLGVVLGDVRPDPNETGTGVAQTGELRPRTTIHHEVPTAQLNP